MKREGPPYDESSTEPEIEDFVSRSFYPLLKKIHPELRRQHLIRIDKDDYTDEEATEYILDLLERRSEVLTETVISDSDILEKMRGQRDTILKQIETSVFTDKENLLGFGMTARVKKFLIEDLTTHEVVPVAVKYLLTPTSMTLSASAEHDMLLEVERIQEIEKLEVDAHLRFIKVPHPYFHHQNSDIQCYGMELIDGFDLSKDLVTMPEGKDKEALVKELAAVDFAEVEVEIETFFARMHEYCIHGDIKPANLMVGKSGQFYVIDFGQSRLISDIPDNAQDQLYTLREDEVKYTTDSIRKIISDAKTLVAEY